MKLKKYAYSYSRCPNGNRMTGELQAENFFDAIRILNEVSSDAGPTIYFVIELPEVKDEVG